MATVVEMSDTDLECGGGGGGHRSSAASDGDEDEGSLCFSDEGSCYSQFYSTANGSYDNYDFSGASDSDTDGVSGCRRVSSAAGSDYSVDVENGFGEIKVHLERVERDCRICHLSLESSGEESNGIAIELGCSCKDDLAAAHKHCAEAWFKIKGNKTCEICNSVACNVVGPNEIEPAQQTNETNAMATNAASSAPVPPTTQTRSCLNGYKMECTGYKMERNRVDMILTSIM
ncbi:hypothetical protein RJ639_003381 [Escallonia herrerae]|uniref:RING-CH-type domain-containing protein n=1 Tax=Escallonia herrerae TaxID=1293975 RepID=A0AA89AY99_9ASTE|nr:hypothetical protein RJ639_003381 [Escallonia herrerae]